MKKENCGVQNLPLLVHLNVQSPVSLSHSFHARWNDCELVYKALAHGDS
jgi:hypothetical protein